MNGTISSRLWRPRFAGLALALSAALLPAAAQADDTPASARYGPGTAGEATAWQIARDAWGVEACGGAVTVGWGVLDPMVNARSDWKNATDAFANPKANVQCTITFNSTLSFTWEEYCTVMVHEYGHLVGQRHSEDEHSVMYPSYVEAFPACAATPDPAPASLAAAESASTAAVAPATTKAKSEAKPKARSKQRRSTHSRSTHSQHRARRHARARVHARQLRLGRAHARQLRLGRAHARQLRLRRAHARETRRAHARAGRPVLATDTRSTCPRLSQAGP
jgi:hypothetical protein